jgi:hypothetical protein
MLLRVGDGHRLVPTPEDALDRLVPTDRPLMEALRHVGVGREAALADRGAEFRDVGDPQREGDGRHREELRELGVTGAELTVVPRKSGVVRAIAGGEMADDAHDRHMGTQ